MKMKQAENLIDFLKNGEFKSAPFGIEQAQFIKKFGKSNCFLTISKKDKRISLLKYGMVEFYFKPCDRQMVLNGVMIQPNILPCKWLRYSFEALWLKTNLNYGEVLKNLSESDIAFNEGIDMLDQHIIDSEGEVRFYFHDEDKSIPKERFILNKIGKFELESHSPFKNLLKVK